VIRFATHHFMRFAIWLLYTPDLTLEDMKILLAADTNYETNV
jgi:hypothetical protein